MRLSSAVINRQSRTATSFATARQRWYRSKVLVPLLLTVIILVSHGTPLHASFVDIGPRSNLLFTPSPETSATLSLASTAGAPTLRGIPRAITYDRSGQVILVSESTTSCIASGQLGIDITVYRPTTSLTKPFFNQTVCDDATHVQALAIVADQGRNTLYIAYLVDESPAFINVDKLDSLTGTVENLLSLNATHGQPFTLDVVSLPGSKPTEAGPSRVFAGGNENVWYVEDRVADVALLYPLGNTIVALATTVLPPTLRLPPITVPGESGEPETIPDTGARLYAVVRSDVDGALFLHMQDAYNPEVAVADVDLEVTAPMRVLQPPTPRVIHPPRPSANDSKLQPSVPMRHGLVACGEAVYLLLQDARNPATGTARVRTFSAVDLAEVTTPLILSPADHGQIVDFACERETSQLLVLTRSTSAQRFSGTGGVGLPRESLMVITPALRILSVQPFGAIVKSVQDGSATVNFRRVALGAGLHRGMNLVTLMQAVPDPARPDVPKNAGGEGKTPELVLGAMASVNCIRQATSQQQQRLQPRDGVVGSAGYLCAPCAMATSASSNPGVKIAPVGTAGSGSTCLFLRQQSNSNAPSPISPNGGGQNGSSVADPNKPCGEAPYYRDERTGQCRICTGEWDGKQCRTVLEADANRSSSRKPGAMSMSVSVLVGTVGAVGAIVGVLGGFLYHRKQQQSKQQHMELALGMAGPKGGRSGGGAQGTIGRDGVYNATPRMDHGSLGRGGGGNDGGADSTLDHILHAIPLVSAKVAPAGGAASSSPELNSFDPFKSQPQSQSHTRNTTTETTTSTGVSEMLRAAGGQAAPPIPRALGLVPPRSATSSPAATAPQTLEDGGKKQHEGRPPTDSMQWPGPPAGPPPVPLRQSPKAPAKSASVVGHRRGTAAGGDDHMRSVTAGSVEATLFHSHAGDAPPRAAGSRGVQQSRSVPNNLNQLASSAEPNDFSPPPVPPPPALAYLGLPGSLSRTASATLAATHHNYSPNSPPYPYGPWATSNAPMGGSTYDLTTSSGILGALPVPPSPLFAMGAAASLPMHHQDSAGSPGNTARIPESNPSYVHLTAVAAAPEFSEGDVPPVPPLAGFPADLSGIFPQSPTCASDPMMLPTSAAASTVSLAPVRRNPSNASAHSFAQSVIIASATSSVARSRPPSGSIPPLGPESPQVLVAPSATSTVSVPVARSSTSPPIVVKRRY